LAEDVLAGRVELDDEGVGSSCVLVVGLVSLERPSAEVRDPFELAGCVSRSPAAGQGSDGHVAGKRLAERKSVARRRAGAVVLVLGEELTAGLAARRQSVPRPVPDRKSTRLNSSH